MAGKTICVSTMIGTVVWLFHGLPLQFCFFFGEKPEVVENPTSIDTGNCFSR